MVFKYYDFSEGSYIWELYILMNTVPILSKNITEFIRVVHSNI